MTYQVILFKDKYDSVADTLTNDEGGYRIFADNVRLDTPEDRDKLVAALNALEFERYVKPGDLNLFTKLRELEPRTKYTVLDMSVVRGKSSVSIADNGAGACVNIVEHPDATILDLLNKAAGR